MKLRDYQEFAIQSVFDYFESGKTGNPLIGMPTGTGKSLVIAGLLRRIFELYPNQKVMMLTHVKELISQNYAKLKLLWPEASSGIYSSGLKSKDIWEKIIFGGIASVAKNASLFGRVDLLIIDECHMVNPSENGQYAKFIAALKIRNPLLKVIGLTATPYRLGHGSIVEDGLFTDFCCDMTGMDAFNWFVNQGYLVPLIPRQTELTLDISGVKKVGGDYVASELANAIDKAEITERALRESLDVAYDRNRWLIFAAGVEHAEHIADMLTNMGVGCRPVHSKQTGKTRDDNIAWFSERSEDSRALVNNGVLTTGFDHPGIDLLLILRPTTSPGLWVQICGRGTRPDYASGYDLSTQEGRLASIAAGKPNTLVLDYAGNTRRIGPINDPSIPSKKGKGGGEAPVKECDKCKTINHASARHCIFCGFEFLFQTKLKEVASSADLIVTSEPKIEILRVDHITYSPHIKEGSPTSMKATYHCGYLAINEFVCFEHTGYALHKAHVWWKSRNGGVFPKTTEETLRRVGELAPATHLKVITNKKYPEIKDHCFDGSAFGELPADDSGAYVGMLIKDTPDGNRYKKKEKTTFTLADVPF